MEQMFWAIIIGISLAEIYIRLKQWWQHRQIKKHLGLEIREIWEKK